MCLKLRIAGIHSFGRKRQQKILVEFQPSLFKHRQQDFIGRAGIGGRFKNDQLAVVQPLLDFFSRSEDVGNVRLFGFSQRRRDADDDGVAIVEMVEISCRAQPLASTSSFTIDEATSPM